METVETGKPISANAPTPSAWDKAFFNSLRFFEHFLGRKIGKTGPAQKLLNQLYRMNEQSILKKLSTAEAGGFHEIDQCTSITPEHFHAQYRDRARPLVIRNAARDWACTHKWTPEFFGRTYGDDRVILINDHIATDESVEDEITLREIVDNLDSDIAKYARFVPILANHPELLHDFDVNWLAERIDDDGRVKLWGEKGPGAKLRSHLFIGRKGTKTELHCALTNNFFINVYGKKQWYIISPEYNPMVYSPVNWVPGVFGTEMSPANPDHDRYPLQKYIHGYKVTLEPGDVLFNPPFWWHHVTNITNCVSIGIRWYSFANAMKASVTQNLLSLIATNPTILTSVRNAIEYGKTHENRKRRSPDATVQ